MGLMAYVAEKAQELQSALPIVADDWDKKDISQEEIARQRDLVSFLNLHGSNPEDIATSVVRTALYGFDDMGKISGFPGLVTRDVYAEVAKRHKLKALEKYNNEGQSSLKNMSAEVLRELSGKGVLARGRVLIKDEEKKFAYECSLDSAYVGRGGPDWEKVRSAVNDKFYDGRDVRTKRAARGMVDVYKEGLREKN